LVGVSGTVNIGVISSGGSVIGGSLTGGGLTLNVVDIDGGGLASGTLSVVTRLAGQSQPKAYITTIAGENGGDGCLDAQGTNARFSSIKSPVFDSQGNMYVVSLNATLHESLIRKIDLSGNVTTVAGKGRGLDMDCLAVDGQNNIYVACGRIIYKLGTDGVFAIYCDLSSQMADGTVRAMTFDVAGNLYMATQDHLWKVAVDKTVSQIQRPPQIAYEIDDMVVRSGVLYVADSSGKIIAINTSDYTNVTIHTSDGGYVAPTLTSDASGNIYYVGVKIVLSDYLIYSVETTRLDNSEAVTIISQVTLDTTDMGEHFSTSQAVRNAAGDCYIIGGLAIGKMAASGKVSPVAGKHYSYGSRDGRGAEVRFDTPKGIAVDSNGNLYIVDSGNSTIRKIDHGGVVSTFAGTVYSSPGRSDDGVGSNAYFNYPAGVAVDANNNLYITDENNYIIRKITPDRAVLTIAGTANTTVPPESIDGVGAAARFHYPNGIAFTPSGQMVVADYYADYGYMGGVFSSTVALRTLTTSGSAGTLAVITTGTLAHMNWYDFAGITVDSAGDIYFADTNGNVIRKVDAQGHNTIVAGQLNRIGSADGAGTAAGFDIPSGLATDKYGYMYVADTDNNAIRRLDPVSGEVVTIIGKSGEKGVIDSDAANARLSQPLGICVDTKSSGLIYITDAGEYVVRALQIGPEFITQPTGTSVAAGAAVTLKAEASGAPYPSYQWYKDGIAITGGTETTWVINNIQTGGGGNYTVVASNTFAANVFTATSSIASVLVTGTDGGSSDGGGSGGGGDSSGGGGGSSSGGGDSGGGGGALGMLYFAVMAAALTARRFCRKN
jgi:sugar lactone lactonase YvrE